MELSVFVHLSPLYVVGAGNIYDIDNRTSVVRSVTRAGPRSPDAASRLSSIYQWRERARGLAPLLVVVRDRLSAVSPETGM